MITTFFKKLFKKQEKLNLNTFPEKERLFEDKKYYHKNEIIERCLKLKGEVFDPGKKIESLDYKKCLRLRYYIYSKKNICEILFVQEDNFLYRNLSSKIKNVKTKVGEEII
ncbi:MAG: hypothetical protein ACOCP8_03600 [archaeon]